MTKHVHVKNCTCINYLTSIAEHVQHMYNPLITGTIWQARVSSWFGREQHTWIQSLLQLLSFRFSFFSLKWLQFFICLFRLGTELPTHNMHALALEVPHYCETKTKKIQLIVFEVPLLETRESRDTIQGAHNTPSYIGYTCSHSIAVTVVHAWEKWLYCVLQIFYGYSALGPWFNPKTYKGLWFDPFTGKSALSPQGLLMSVIWTTGSPAHGFRQQWTPWPNAKLTLLFFNHASFSFLSSSNFLCLTLTSGSAFSFSDWSESWSDSIRGVSSEYTAQSNKQDHLPSCGVSMAKQGTREGGFL